MKISTDDASSINRSLILLNACKKQQGLLRETLFGSISLSSTLAKVDEIS